ncbi:MAG: uroporphyrinogen decarboxylase family protein [Actinomycetota bacterium]|nr:uroporphyrinogen decarboxylase family protein [Actinomycetota bacterium]
MTSRERVWKTLNHKEPDRIPVDLGGNSSGMTDIAYRKLTRYYGMKNHTAAFSEWRTVKNFDEEILELLNIDIREIHMGQPQGYKSFNYSESEDSFEDEWGIRRKNTGDYSQIIYNPLSVLTIDDLKNFHWPDPHDPVRVAGLQEKAKRLFENTDYAIKLADPMSLFNEISCMLRGFEKFMVDLITNEKFVSTLVEKELELLMGFYGSALDAAGEYIQIVETSDDYGMQNGPMISPSIYKKFFKKAHKRLNDFIRSKTGAKILLHSCGSVRAFIPDFIDTGIDILNPVQPYAADMNLKEIKNEFGKYLCFHGGIDMPRMLCGRAIKDIEENIKEVIRAMAAGGGYILAPTHNIQPDIPPENVIAIYKYVNEHGRYPIEV